MYMLAYNLIRLLRAQAAAHAGMLPRQLSFKHTLQVWIAWSQRLFLSGAPENAAGLFRVIARIREGIDPAKLSHGWSNEGRSFFRGFRQPAAKRGENIKKHDIRKDWQLT